MPPNTVITKRGLRLFPQMHPLIYHHYRSDTVNSNTVYSRFHLNSNCQSTYIVFLPWFTLTLFAQLFILRCLIRIVHLIWSKNLADEWLGINSAQPVCMCLSCPAVPACLDTHYHICTVISPYIRTHMHTTPHRPQTINLVFLKEE